MGSREYEVNRAKLAKRQPIHPGVIFAEEVMPELRKDRSIAEIAALLGVSRASLHRLMAGDIGVSVEMALRLGKLCGNGPELWLTLQANYDTFKANRRLGKVLERIPTIR